MPPNNLISPPANTTLPGNFSVIIRPGETAHGVTYNGPTGSELAFTATASSTTAQPGIFQLFHQNIWVGSVTFHEDTAGIPCTITLHGQTYSKYLNDEAQLQPLVFQHASFVRLVADAWPLDIPSFGIIPGPLR